MNQSESFIDFFVLGMIAKIAWTLNFSIISETSTDCEDWENYLFCKLWNLLDSRISLYYGFR